MEQSKQQRIRELTDRLNRCRYEYYNLNAPSLTDAEYDALFDELSTLEKETDLVNGRIDKDQYDMTGRLVQSTTLEKNTGTSGEPIVANTHTVQSLEIGYDSYNRVNRLVQSLETAKTKTALCTEMHQRHSDRDYPMDLLSMEHRDKV